jgi:hypothetical protein
LLVVSFLLLSPFLSSFQCLAKSVGTTIVEVDGVRLIIGINGIINPETDPQAELFRLPMTERLVILSPIGQGASSTVYKVRAGRCVSGFLISALCCAVGPFILSFLPSLR